MLEKDIEDDIYRTKLGAIALSIGSIILFVMWATFPLYNTNYISNVSGADNLLLDTRYGLAWITVVMMIGNVLLPYLLLGVLIKNNSMIVADLHVVVTWIMFILNILSAIGLFIFFLIGTNSLWSGQFGLPFNDLKWCCVYHLDMPSLCPNTIACDPAVSATELVTSAIFDGHWVFSVVFFILVLMHMMLNRLLRTTGTITINWKSITSEGKLLGVIYAFIFACIFVYWTTIPLYNTNVLHGYPRFDTPDSPNNFESWRYGWQYFSISTLVLNILPILTFLGAIMSNRSKIMPTVYWFTSIIVGLLDFLVVAFLVGVWIFNCNYPTSGGSICNDYQWCWKFFADAYTLCPNISGLTVGLTPNIEFIQHMIYGFVFLIMNMVGIWLQQRMKVYKVFFN